MAASRPKPLVAPVITMVAGVGMCWIRFWGGVFRDELGDRSGRDGCDAGGNHGASELFQRGRQGTRQCGVIELAGGRGCGGGGHAAVERGDAEGSARADEDGSTRRLLLQ